MPVGQLRAGMDLYNLSPAEVTDATLAALDRQQRVRARGFKPNGQLLETFSLTDAASTVYIDAIAPAEGMIRNIKLISVQLASADTCQAFVGTSKDDTRRLVSNFGASATSQIATWSSSQLMLDPGQGIVIKTVAHAPTVVFVTYAEVIAEMAFKAFD